jgi:transposase
MDREAPRRRRRIHSEEFKAQAVESCKQPGVSVASVAMTNGINANLLRRWVQAAASTPAVTPMPNAEPVGFIALPMPAAPTTQAEPIRIELQRGQTTIAVTWPVTAADACAAWLREILR